MIIKTSQELEPIQKEILEQLRSELGPLVGTALVVQKDKGWSVKVSPLRKLSDEERGTMVNLLNQFDVPIIVEEHGRPAWLLTRTQQPNL